MAIAYGFVTLQDQFTTRVNTIGTERIWTAIDESAAEHNRVVNELMAAMVERTTVAQEQFELPGGGTLQPLDADGNPSPVKPSGSYQVGYPVQGAGTAWADNRVVRALMTVREANRLTVNAQQQDVNWLRRHMLAALLDNVAWTFHDETGPDGSKGLGDITIQPLANGDTVEYVMKGGDSATDDHYIGQANAIDDSNNPFPTIHTELNEHPSNSGPFVAYIATNLKTAVQGLANFVPVNDPDVVPGSGSDTLAGTITPGFGDEVLGKVDNMWIVEWGVLPDSYILAHARGGGPPLKMREYPAEELQGFFREPFDSDGNHKGERMLRYAGFGVGNRVAAVAVYIGNATYQVPAAYGAPLGV